MKKYILLFFLFLFCSAPLWAQQDSTAVQGDSSRIAGWSLSYCFTEPLFSGHRFRFEGNLSPKKGHWRYFIAPAYFGAMLEESRFVQNDDLPVTEPEVTEFEGQSRLRGAGLALGVVLRPNGKAFYPEIKGLSQGYLQFSVGGSLLSREFEDATWVVRNGVYRPGFAKLRERLYRTDLMLGGGVRVHTYFKGFVDFYFGLAYRHAWQTETLNEGWRETDNTFFALNYTGISPRMRMRIGWTHPRGEKRFVPQINQVKHYATRKRSYSSPKRQAKHEAYLKKREAERAEYRASLAKRRGKPLDSLNIPDSLGDVKWTLTWTPSTVIMNGLQMEWEIRLRDNLKQSNAYFFLSPILYFDNENNVDGLSRGAGFFLGGRHRFGWKAFRFSDAKVQGFAGFFAGYHGAEAEQLMETPLGRTRITVDVRRVDVGFEAGGRLLRGSGLCLDFFGAVQYRRAWIPERENVPRENEVVADYNFFRALYNGFAPKLGLRLGYARGEKLSQ